MFYNIEKQTEERKLLIWVETHWGSSTDLWVTAILCSIINNTTWKSLVSLICFITH